MRSSIRSFLPYVPASLATGLVLWLSFIAIYKWGPHWQHDYPSYHLPFIVRDLNISTWQLWPSMLPFWEGYPPLAHYIQGAVIYLTGKPNLANAINFIAILLFIATVRQIKPQLDLPWLILAMMAIPLFLLNFPSGGLDIWFSLGVLVQFICLADILTGDKRKILHIVFIAAVAVVMLSKMNGWAVSIFFSIVYGIYRLRELKTEPASVLTSYLFLAIALAYWPLRNWIIMGSPAWPIAIGFLSTYGFDIQGLSSTSVRPDMFADTPRFLRYFISFFELTRFVTDESLRWTFTMWAGGPGSPHQMMGGLNGYYMAAMLIYFVFLIKHKLVPRTSWFLFLGSMLVASLLPQSHEMRYSLYVPLILLTLCTLYADKYSRIFHIIVIAALVMLATNKSPHSAGFSLLHNQLLLKNSPITQFWREQERLATEHLPNAKEEAVCIPGTEQYWGLADPMGIYFTGPTLNDYKVKACRSDCTLPWQNCGFEW